MGGIPPYLSGNLMGRPPEGKWFGRTGGEPPSLYAEPRYNWSMGEVGPFIRSAAIRLKSGRIFTGRSHHEAMEEFDKVFSIRDWKRLVDDSDGFITNKGKYLTRKEAVRITGQKSEDAADIVGRSMR